MMNHAGLAMAFLSASATLAGAQGGLSSPFGGNGDDDGVHATMRLALPTERATPGVATLAVVFDIDDQWHLYWKNPGDTGLPPAVTFTLPEGVELAGELQWPAPRRYIHGGGRLLDYIYEDELALLQPIRIDSALAGETVRIEASGTWLVCREACLPGEGADEIVFEVGESPGAETEDAALIERMRERVPVAAEEIDLEATWDDLTLVLTALDADRMEIMPLEPPLGGPADAIRQGAGFGSELRVPYDPRVREASRVVVVVGVSRDGQTRFGRLELEAPGG